MAAEICGGIRSSALVVSGDRVPFLRIKTGSYLRRADKVAKQDRKMAALAIYQSKRLCRLLGVRNARIAPATVWSGPRTGTEWCRAVGAELGFWGVRVPASGTADRKWGRARDAKFCGVLVLSLAVRALHLADVSTIHFPFLVGTGVRAETIPVWKLESVSLKER